MLVTLSAETAAAQPKREPGDDRQAQALKLINAAMSARVGHKVDLGSAPERASRGPGRDTLITAFVLGGLTGIALTKMIYPRLVVKGDLSPSSVVSSADGETVLLSFDQGFMAIWDLRRGREVARWTTRAERPAAIAVANAGQFAVAAWRDGAVTRIDAGGERGFLDRAGAVRLMLDANGGYVTLWDAGGRIQIRDMANGALVPRGGLESPALGAAPGGRRNLTDAAVSGGRAEVVIDHGEVQLRDRSSGQRLGRLITTATGWAVLDFEGRFDGDAEGLSAFAWSDKDITLDTASLAKRYFEPGILSDLIRPGTPRAGLKSATVENGVKPPPKVAVVTPEAPKPAGNPEVVLVIAEDQGGGLDSVRLFHNGKLVDPGAMIQTREILIADRRVRASAYLITPTAGVNTLRASAASAEELEGVSPRLSRVHDGSRAPGTLYVLTVGIDGYSAPLSKLSVAGADASSVDQVFAKATPSFSKTVQLNLREGQATRSGILRALDTIAAQARPEDTVIVFLAGHGFAISRTEWVFGTMDTNASTAETARQTGLLSADLQAKLVAVKAQHVVLAIDACQSASVFGPFRDQKAFYLKTLSDVSRSTGLIIYAATQAVEDAFELPELGHGLFTYALLDALATKTSPQNAVTAFVVADRVERAVPQLALRYNNESQNTAVFRLGADFPVR